MQHRFHRVVPQYVLLQKAVPININNTYFQLSFTFISDALNLNRTAGSI